MSLVLLKFHDGTRWAIRRGSIRRPTMGSHFAPVVLTASQACRPDVFKLTATVDRAD
jgi:hypothetical protein